MPQLVKLFEPGKIGNLDIRNRLVMAPMTTFSANEDGSVTDRIVEYYAARARGGVGLVMVEAAFIMPGGRNPHQLAINDDEFIPGLRRIASAIQAAGARASLQVSHSGVSIYKQAPGFEQNRENRDFIGPSEVPCLVFGTTPREISKAEIHELAEIHAKAAKRVKDSGFDLVEIHAAHGYFLSAFLSPFKNRRKDEYGGSVENRARFVCEVVRLTRERVGKDFPISLRINGSDFFEGGITIEDTVRQAPMFVEAGASVLHVSASAVETAWARDLSYLHPDGALVELAAAIKKAVAVPIITVGKIGDPLLAESILREGKADFVAMGRALFVDPELANKAREGRLKEIRRCIYCNHCRTGVGRLDRIQARGTSIICTMNPDLAREKEAELKPAASPKKVMVIGGGPAGMEAATILARRGHHVTLYDRNKRLGGEWNVVSQIPDKGNFARLTDYLAGQLEKTSAKVNLGKTVDKRLVEKERPDAVVVATGSIPIRLNIKGIDGDNVVQATDVFTGQAKVGQKVVVIGGRLVGMEVADLLASQGKKVAIVTKKRLGENGEPLERNIYVTMRDRLVERGVTVYPHCPVFEVSAKGVYIVDGMEIQFLEADTVVLAVGVKPENTLLQELKGIVPEVYVIGDSAEPRHAADARLDAGEIGRKI